MKSGAKVVIEPHRHAGIFIAKGKEDALVTRNMVPGESVYGEKRIRWAGMVCVCVHVCLGHACVQCRHRITRSMHIAGGLHASFGAFGCSFFVTLIDSSSHTLTHAGEHIAE